MTHDDWDRAIDGFRAELEAAGRPKTTQYLRTYHVRKFHRDTGRDLTGVTRGLIIGWLAAQELKPNTRHSYRASMSVFFKWAYKNGLIEKNPADDLPTVSLPRAVPRPAPSSVVDIAMRHTSIRVRAMVSILAETGIRRGELCRIHTKDLERTLELDLEYADARECWSLRVTGKGGHERVVPISDRLASMIRAYPSGHLFPGQIDGHLSPARAGELVSEALGPGWTAHNIRHRYASLAYSVERDLRAVQELLGHAKITTTQIYTYVPQASMRRASEGARRGLTA